jgi:hypothetical protein
MRRGALIALLLVASSPARAQPSGPPGTVQPNPPPQPVPPPPPQPYPPPPPQPYPPPPPPYAYPPPPQPIAAEEEPPPFGAQPDDWMHAIALFHGFCPTDANPMCGGGLWVGLRGLMVAGLADSPAGIAIDMKGGFGFGFGSEVKKREDPQEARASSVHVMCGIEAGVGPGLRLGVLDVMPVAGIGLETLAWASNETEDVATGEAFWYGQGALQLRLGEVALIGTAARQYKTEWVHYADRLEVGVSWKGDQKNRFGLTGWWIEHERWTMAGFGFAVSPMSKRRD